MTTTTTTTDTARARLARCGWALVTPALILVSWALIIAAVLAVIGVAR
jgi:hypothetical protein